MKGLFGIVLGGLLFAAPLRLTAQITSDSGSYSIQDRGSVTLATPGGTGSLVTGYARVQPGAATTAPAAYGVVSYRTPAALVSEASIPAVRTVSSGRIYIELEAGVNTAIGFVNANAVSIPVSLSFTDENGNSIGATTLMLNAGEQLARFVSEFPFNLNAFRGTMTFSAGAPVAAIALHTRINTRGDFLMTGVPIAPLQTNFSSPLTLAHFADGDGWKTQVILVNGTDQAVSGTVQFFNEGTAFTPAVPLSLVVNELQDTVFSYRIPARSAVKLETSGTAAAVQAGSIRIASAQGSATPFAFALTSLTNGTVMITEATTSAETASSAFRLYAEAVLAPGQTGSIQTALAMSNPSATPATVTLELWTPAGTATGFNTIATIPAFGQVAGFFSDIFPAVPLPFRGLIRVTAATSQIVLSAFRTRYNERGEFLFTGIAVSNEGTPGMTGEVIIPQIADMGGYSTEFVLFSGALSQSALGTLRFLNPAGQSLDITLR
jgi:hypothetical protein